MSQKKTILWRLCWSKETSSVQGTRISTLRSLTRHKRDGWIFWLSSQGKGQELNGYMNQRRLQLTWKLFSWSNIQWNSATPSFTLLRQRGKITWGHLKLFLTLVDSYQCFTSLTLQSKDRSTWSCTKSSFNQCSLACLQLVQLFSTPGWSTSKRSMFNTTLWSRSSVIIQSSTLLIVQTCKRTLVVSTTKACSS